MSRIRFSSGILFLAAAVIVPITTSAARADGKKYAFLVGINKYDHPESLPALQYAENDVVALGELLHKQGFEIVLLSDASAKKEKNDGFKPTKGNIETQLGKLLKKCDGGDVLLLGFSGHGMYFDE